ncbi:hypothetical protein K2Z83_18335 [Oscillochloris sp. ZM17-4]|uniref:hypothetical protein n=1 Tax=Oscillochloris sp. ZM17-4 TaxID=2866714 RepID=UPI001C7349A5|nr:hypothetical protein [Oscillochloris sp. ZM17-4]MBX0329632.1 hypothetical protein [Oscillochloris sp. ZM17-4]
MRMVVGLIDQGHSSDQTIAALGDAGISRDQISLIGNDLAIHQIARVRGAIHGAGIGGLIGAALGALLGLSLTLIALSGAGPTPIIYIGPMNTFFGVPLMIGGSVLAWAGLMASMFSLLGSLIGESRLDQQARAYTQGVEHGETMVAVRAEDGQVEAVADQLRRAGAEQVDAQRRFWKRGDWEAFDVGGPPLRHPARV